MIRHPFTLDRLAAALNTMLKGMWVDDAWTQEKYTAVLTLSGGKEELPIEIDLTPRGGTILPKQGVKRGRTNTLDIFPTLRGQKVVMVTRQPDDRIVTIWFESSQLHVELFSSGSGNVVLVQNGIITDALRRRRDRVGHTFHVTDHQRPVPLLNQEDSIGRSFANSTLELGKHYSREVCLRCAIDPNVRVQDLTESERDNLLSAADTVLREISLSETFYVLDAGAESLLSLIPLRGHSITETHTNVVHAIASTVKAGLRSIDFEARKRSVLGQLRSTATRLERSISGMQSSAARYDRASEYRACADALLSYPPDWFDGKDSMVVERDNGTIIQYTIQPDLSVVEQAQSLYAKAKAAETALRARESKLPVLQKNLESINNQIRIAESVTTLQDLKQFERTNMLPSDSKDESSGKYRVFHLDDVHTIYVGKSAANNDELTMRFAKQNDWWLHAKGVSGSHAVLRGSPNSKPPKQILEKAAAITAYYSQARNASYVSVVFTQRKYVRKPKGANVGAVVLDREQTVMVRPWIPDTTEES